MIKYAKSWFRGKKRVTEPWDETRARQAHERKETYVATVYRDDVLYCFLEITTNSICVGFLDSRIREHLTYSFQRKEGDQIFLSQVRQVEFDGDTDQVVKGSLLLFEIDGRMSIHNYVHETREVDVFQSEDKVDVSSNWDIYPEFGKYDSLIRIER